MTAALIFLTYVLQVAALLVGVAVLVHVVRQDQP